MGWQWLSSLGQYALTIPSVDCCLSAPLYPSPHLCSRPLEDSVPLPRQCTRSVQGKGERKRKEGRTREGGRTVGRALCGTELTRLLFLVFFCSPPLLGDDDFRARLLEEGYILDALDTMKSASIREDTYERVWRFHFCARARNGWTSHRVFFFFFSVPFFFAFLIRPLPSPVSSQW